MPVLVATDVRYRSSGTRPRRFSVADGNRASFAGNERTVSLGTVFAFFVFLRGHAFAPQILPENAREPYFEAVGGNHP